MLRRHFAHITVFFFFKFFGEIKMMQCSSFRSYEKWMQHSVLGRAVKQHHTESSCSYCITVYKIYNSVVRRRKDSLLEIYVGLMVSIAIISNITLDQLPQLVLYMAQQYRQGSREAKNLYRGIELLSRNQTSAFFGRESHLGHKNVKEKPLSFLHPLANYEGCSRNYAPAWEICCSNFSPHRPETKSQWCQKRFLYFAQKERTLETSCLLTMYYFS